MKEPEDSMWDANIVTIVAIIVFVAFAYALKQLTGVNPYAEFCSCKARVCETCGKKVMQNEP